MTKQRIACSLFSLSSLILLLANGAWASVCDDIHDQLSAGQSISAQEADLLSSELLKDSKNPFKHLVAGEALVSLGLYNQAEDQFEEADSLQKDYVQSAFREELKAKHHTLRFLCPYLQKKHPDDPALLFYLANRDLAGLQLKQNSSKVALRPIIDEFNRAAVCPDPWTDVFALLAMLEYNEALRTAGEDSSHKDGVTARESLLQLSIKHAKQELKRDPKNTLALKVLVLSSLQSGCSADKLSPALEKLVKVSPGDLEVNLLLGRIYLARNDYKSAMRPVLISLLAEPAGGKPDSIKQAYELVHHADPTEISASAHELMGELGRNGDKANLLCLKVADILASAGKTRQSLELLGSALRDCPPSFRLMFELRIGQVLTRIHRYDEAFVYLDKACQGVLDPVLRWKLVQMRDRVACLRDNCHRDLAVQLKTLFVPISE